MAGMRITTALLALLFVTGCVNYAEVGPGVDGSDLANQRLQSELRVPVADTGVTFGPVERAEDAVRKARQAGVSAGRLDKAAQLAEQAAASWQALDNPAEPASDKLAAIAHKAHRARRLAEIARFEYTASQNRARIQQFAETQTTLAANGARRMLVPGRFGAIRFQDGTARLAGDSQRVIQRVAETLLQPGRRNQRVGIAGRVAPITPSAAEVTSFIRANQQVAQRVATTAQKRSAYRQALAITRARAVARGLVQAGVEARRLKVSISRAQGGQTRGDVMIEVATPRGGR